jgi:hypothetical protein
VGSKHMAGCEQCSCVFNYTCDGCCQEGIQRPEYLRPTYTGLEFESSPTINSWDPLCCCLTQVWNVKGEGDEVGLVQSCCTNLYTANNTTTTQRKDRYILRPGRNETGWGSTCCLVFSDLVCGTECCLTGTSPLVTWEGKWKYYGRADFATKFYIKVVGVTWAIQPYTCNDETTCKVVVSLTLAGFAEYRLNQLRLREELGQNAIQLADCEVVIPETSVDCSNTSPANPNCDVTISMVRPQRFYSTPTSQDLLNQCTTRGKLKEGCENLDYRQGCGEGTGILPICFKRILTYTIAEWNALQSGTLGFDDSALLEEGCDDARCKSLISCGIEAYTSGIAIFPPNYSLPYDCTNPQYIFVPNVFPWYENRDVSVFLCPSSYSDYCIVVDEQGDCVTINVSPSVGACPARSCPPFYITRSIDQLAWPTGVPYNNNTCRLKNFICEYPVYNLYGVRDTLSEPPGTGVRRKSRQEDPSCYDAVCYCNPCCGVDEMQTIYDFKGGTIHDAYMESYKITERTTNCAENPASKECSFHPGWVYLNIEYPSDRTPDPINWTSITYDCPANTCEVTSEQVTGITGPITLLITALVGGSPNSGPPDLYYKISSAQQTGPLTGPPDGTWTKITTNPFTTPLIFNNQWVSFAVYDTTNSDASRLIDISGGTPSVPLDTFTISSTSCPDYTPNPTPNWNNLSHDIVSDESNIVSQRFLGINRPLSIKLDIGAGTQPVLYYKKSSTNLSGLLPIGPPDSSWIAVTSDTTITINLNDWLNFRCYNADLTVSSRTFDVVNVSDANTVLDTITYESY